MLKSIPDVKQMIDSGETLLLAGSAAALSQLPSGNWIGGSISYFMDEDGGVNTDSGIFVTQVPPSALSTRIKEYGADGLQELYSDAPTSGFTFLIVPSGAPFLQAFARNAPDCKGFLLRPVVGWVTGVPVPEIGKAKAIVVDGRTGRTTSDTALAMHIELPENRFAELEIINIFKPGTGPAIRFPSTGFSATTCEVDGQPSNLAEYMASLKIGKELPLTADYCGSIVNVSLQSVDQATGTVHFYAPVFPGIEYRFAAAVGDYAQAFAQAIPAQHDTLFSCNCILNYLYGELEGKHTGGVTGPITFGEIAHQLLNQTLVQLNIREIV
ncbi:MAG: hypothetical protein QM757_46475 [Paludibaculum sp.]